MAGIPRETTRPLSYADYRTWSDAERCELIDGVVYLMSPSPTRQHQAMVRSLLTQLSLGLQGNPCHAYGAPLDVRFPESPDVPDDDVGTVLQPDILVVCDETKLDDRGCRGAPDFIVEVISPASAAQDRIRKFRVYERSGVREYWLVQPAEHLVTVHVLEASGRYGRGSVHEGTGSLPVSVLPGVSIDLDALFCAE